MNFAGDGRWRQVIRRCASVASTGVTGVCNWGVYENGVYWEECYCSEDACNRSPNLYSTTTTYICLLTTIFAFLINRRWTNLRSISQLQRIPSTCLSLRLLHRFNIVSAVDTKKFFLILFRTICNFYMKFLFKMKTC